MPIDIVRRWFRGDRWIPWTFVAMFGVIIIANGTMMFFAFDSWTGLSTNDSYKRGLVYNESLAKQETQARLGWKIASGFQPSGRLAGEIRVKMTDKAGSPLGGARVIALVRRPVAKGNDFKLVFDDIGGGRYRTRASFPLPGQWELRYQVVYEGHRFDAQQRIKVQ